MSRRTAQIGLQRSRATGDSTSSSQHRPPANDYFHQPRRLVRRRAAGTIKRQQPRGRPRSPEGHQSDPSATAQPRIPILVIRFRVDLVSLSPFRVDSAAHLEPKQNVPFHFIGRLMSQSAVPSIARTLHIRRRLPMRLLGCALIPNPIRQVSCPRAKGRPWSSLAWRGWQEAANPNGKNPLCVLPRPPSIRFCDARFGTPESTNRKPLRSVTVLPGLSGALFRRDRQALAA